MDTLLLYGLAITALIVSDIILVVLGVVVYRLYRARRDENTQADALAPLRQDLKGVSVSLSVLGERLGRLETQMGRLQERQEQQAQALPSNKEADHRAFQVATKMALQGADVEQIVNLCGLTRGEAELIRMLHAKHVASQEQPAPQRDLYTKIKDAYR